MPKSPTPNSSLSGVIMPRTMFLSISSMRSTRPSTHIGSVNSRTKNGRFDVGDRLAGRLVRGGRRDVRRQPVGDRARGARLVVGVEAVVGAGVTHGGTFCTMGAISLASAGRVAAPRDRRHARRDGARCPRRRPRRSWPSPSRPRSSAGSGRRARCAPATRVPAQLDRADFARPEAPWLVAVFTSATCARRAGRVGAGAAARERRRSRCRRSSTRPTGDLHDRYGIEAVPTTLVVATPTGVVRASFLGPVTATDLWAAVAEARRAGQHARRLRHAGGR